MTASAFNREDDIFTPEQREQLVDTLCRHFPTITRGQARRGVDGAAVAYEAAWETTVAKLELLRDTRLEQAIAIHTCMFFFSRAIKAKSQLTGVLLELEVQAAAAGQA